MQASEVCSLGKLPDRPWTTALMYRSPEDVRMGLKNVCGSMDMWALGIAVTVMAGFRFTDVVGEDKIQSAWAMFLGTPPIDDGMIILPSQAADNMLKQEWPHKVVSTLGADGMEVPTSLLTYRPILRLTAAAALSDLFMNAVALPLMCVEDTDMPKHCGQRDGYGRILDKLFTPDVVLNVKPLFTPDMVTGQNVVPGPAQTRSPGKRHDFCIRHRVLSSDIANWAQGDEAFQPGTEANALIVLLATADNEDALPVRHRKRRAIIPRKVRIGGHLGKSSGTAMINLGTTQPCPVSRVLDIMRAFKDVNSAWLRSTEHKAKTATRRLGKLRRGKNGDAFLKQTIDEWFLSACELTFTDAFDEQTMTYFVEDHHNDGCMSVFHGGLTLGGRREMRCDVPGHGRMVVHNEPGTFYFGNLSGPPHQVFHKPCTEQELLYVPGLGYKSVTIMMRTGLYAHDRSRGTEHPTASPAFRKAIERVFVEAMQDPTVRFPTFEEVLRAHDDRVGSGVGASRVTTGIGAGLDAHIALQRDGTKRRIVRKSAPSSTSMMR